MSGDTRLWMYRKGESCLFDHPDDVPEGEDWQRFPQLGEEADGQDDKLSVSEKIDGMSRQRLMQVAGESGIVFETTWTKAQLKQAIIEAMHDNGA